jgi:DNA replicative helicase MCM subunit Mcm2 (Cdc46/Mcm family)
MKNKHRLVLEQEQKEDEERKKQVEENAAIRATMECELKDIESEREKVRRRRRTEERKLDEISLLEFTRQVVDAIVKKHSTPSVITSQRAASARLTPGALEDVRYDSGRHLPKLTSTAGVCKHCREVKKIEKRTKFRCGRCEVALHAECFFDFHVPEDERD